MGSSVRRGAGYVVVLATTPAYADLRRADDVRVRTRSPPPAARVIGTGETRSRRNHASDDHCCRPAGRSGRNRGALGVRDRVPVLPAAGDADPDGRGDPGGGAAPALDAAAGHGAGTVHGGRVPAQRRRDGQPDRRGGNRCVDQHGRPDARGDHCRRRWGGRRGPAASRQFVNNSFGSLGIFVFPRHHCFMYVALLTYTAPQTEVDYALPDHCDWLRKQFTRGLFLVSGKGTDKADQVILTRPVLRGKLDAVLATDPFVVQRLARYEVIEFTATRTAQEFLTINEALAS